MMILPAYEPPSDRRPTLAVSLAPVFVVVLFTLIVSGLIAFDTGVAIFLACTAWVVYELHDYQRAIDDYNQQYVQGHPAWRGHDVPVQDTEAAASDFVRSLIGASPQLADQAHR